MAVLLTWRWSAAAAVKVVVLVAAICSASGAETADGGGTGTERIGDGCSKNDIVVYQAATVALPSGIPTYTVDVHNLCSSSSCPSMSDIHFSCGWFSSARLINPRVFRRLGYNDCLVNDGRPLRSGGSVSFQYANSFKYPLAVASATCSSR